MTPTKERGDPMIIGEIEKNTAERIRVTWETFKGVRFLDVRAYYEDGSGEWKPSKKGIAIAPDKVESLVGLLQKAQKYESGKEQ